MQSQVVEEGTFTVREVALRLGVSKWSIRRYLRRFGISGTVVHANGRPEIHLDQGDVDRLARLLEISLDQPGAKDGGNIVGDESGQSGTVGGSDNRQLILRGVTRQELRELLIEAFTQAMRSVRADEPPPRRGFQETKPGRILTAILYGMVGVMSIACLAFAGAIAKRFDLVRALLQ
jgi:hypothetical protein